MRRPIPLLGAALLLTCAGCAQSAAQPTPSPTPASTPAPTTPVLTVAPTPTLLPTAAAPEPVLSGDAATNPACELLTAAEISAQVGAGVREIRGLTSPGAYGKTGLSCTWYLDSTDIGIPSVTVQWEFPVTTWHDPVVGLYHDFIDQDLAVPIDGVGDFAMLQGRTAEAIEGGRIVRVSVLQHVDPTEKDKADDIALLKLLLERTDQP
jgi:hypothetical protein